MRSVSKEAWSLGQANMRLAGAMLCVALLASLLMSAVPNKTAYAADCKVKHTVLAGETLGYLANLYQVKWEDIAKENKLQPPYVITVGQVLCIPGATTGGSTGTAKAKGDPKLEVTVQTNWVHVAVTSFTPKTPYYVRIYVRNKSISYRIGNFTTDKAGNFADWFRIPPYMPRTMEMEVCVKNTWTDAVSCYRYDDPYYTIGVLARTNCAKEGR
jgi:LysM repeat protein